MSISETIARNYCAVRARIEAACAQASRKPTDVTLIAVTKYAQLDWVQELVQQGAVDLGESRPQQLVARSAALAGSIRWHLIGPLQRNKVRLVLPAATLLHSVDSLRLLETIDRIAGELKLQPRVLLEVNLSGEAAKHGFESEELAKAWDEVRACRYVRVDGLMTMAAYATDPEAARPVFAALRRLRDVLRSRASDGPALEQLSMGMSGDFEVAIEEGATLVRVGTALWEGLAE